MVRQGMVPRRDVIAVLTARLGQAAESHRGRVCSISLSVTHPQLYMSPFLSHSRPHYAEAPCPLKDGEYRIDR